MVYVIIHVGFFFVILSYALSSHGTLLQYGLAAPVSSYSLLQTLHRLNGSKLLCLCIFLYSVCVEMLLGHGFANCQYAKAAQKLKEKV